MDTKNTVSSNIKNTSSADRASVNVDVPNSNIVESDGSGSSGVRTIDMSGTNLPDATNRKSNAERAEDVRENSARVIDTSVPNPHEVKDANNAEDIERDQQKAREAQDKLPQVKIRFVKSHTHEGVDYEEKDVIDVDEQSAEYIVETAEAGVRV
jgi:hypothetical protein